jgi:hypothetical protein
MNMTCLSHPRSGSRPCCVWALLIARSQPLAWTAALLLTVGCGAAAPGAPQIPPAPPPAVRPVQKPSPPPYQRSQDAIGSSFDNERNPFMRRAIGRLWVAIAHVEVGDTSERWRVASAALQDARAAVESQTDVCAGKARAALRWETTTKQAYERRYLAAIDLLGEENIETRSLDAQVQALRDDIDELERTLKSCPDRWFGPED